MIIDQDPNCTTDPTIFCANCVESWSEVLAMTQFRLTPIAGQSLEGGMYQFKQSTMMMILNKRYFVPPWLVTNPNNGKFSTMKTVCHIAQKQSLLAS